MDDMISGSALLVCLAATEPTAPQPAPATRATAIELHGQGRHVEAAEHMTGVFRGATSADERRAAVVFVLGAYRDAFAAAKDKQTVAAHLCAGLALANDYVAGGDPARTIAAPRAALEALRTPFGPCEEPEPPMAVAARPDAIVRPAPASPAPARTVLAHTTPAPRPSRQLFGVGVGVATLGAAIAAGSVAAGVAQADAAADGARAITAGAPDRPFTDEERAMVRSLRGDLDRAYGVIAAGAAAGAPLLVAGVVLAVIGAKRTKTGRVALAPWRRGVAFTLRF